MKAEEIRALRDDDIAPASPSWKRSAFVSASVARRSRWRIRCGCVIRRDPPADIARAEDGAARIARACEKTVAKKASRASASQEHGERWQR
jgi:hypothetical protein